MCGKFTQMMTWRALHGLYSLTDKFTDPIPSKSAPEEVETVTPVRDASVLVWEDGVYNMKCMRWGFAHKSANAPGSRPDHIHARAETIDVLPTFADAFAHRRGLLIVKTFNEGEEVGKKTVQHTITPNDGKPMAIAVIFERWKHDDGSELLTFVMVTTPPNPLIAKITDRMPAVIQRSDWAMWLGEEPASLEQIKAILLPQEGDWSMEPEKKPKQPSLF
ncbi:MAG: SOS response-associated peptidase family protein [Alphaproteobacteria bacterium]|jgi:putative SOS response-associated peptidase YedK